MKYFAIEDSLELKDTPKLKNWYGVFDVRDIRVDTFSKLPEMKLFIIEESKNTIFTDFILFPFLLVSPMVREVIEMYRERCFFRSIILLDQLNKESRMYYLPVLDETRDIQLKKIQYENGKCISDKQKVDGNTIQLDRNVFWVRDSKKRHIILSMNMAESLIRRGVTGLALSEIELYVSAEEM